MERFTQLKDEFPSVYRAWATYGFPELRKTWLGFLLDQFSKDGIEFELAQLEQSLERLLKRFDVQELQDPFGSLYGPRNESQREKAFRKANTELCALAEFERLGALEGLGWPPNFGDNPPFDLQVRAENAVIPVDIKDANGSGLSIAQNALDEIVRPWAQTNNVPPYRIALHYLGVISQRSVGGSIRRNGTLEQFGEWLADYTSIPPDPYEFTVEETSLTVRIVRAGSILHQSGGIQGMNPLVEVLSETFEDHVTDKSEHAYRENKTPFLLVYVQLPGYGSSDIKTAHTFYEAVHRVSQRANGLKHDAGRLWMGSVFFHHKGMTTERYCCLRPAASWPKGLKPEELVTQLKGTLCNLS